MSTQVKFINDQYHRYADDYVHHECTLDECLVYCDYCERELCQFEPDTWVKLEDEIFKIEDRFCNRCAHTILNNKESHEGSSHTLEQACERAILRASKRMSHEHKIQCIKETILEFLAQKFTLYQSDEVQSLWKKIIK